MLRTLLAVVMAVGLVLVGTGIAAAGKPTRVSTIAVDGTGLGLITFQGAAQERGGNPRDVSGYARGSTSVGGQLAYVEGPVVCLDIRGNTAGAIVRAVRSSVPAAVGTYTYATFVDGGRGGVDRGATLIDALPGGQQSCAPRPEITGPFTSGGLVIKDGNA